mmetsp:Transcript_28683/g.84551  ORF Transcript_28683/g.84551 Transcript_28683/m.84551 type:complete len:88 (+) Transcript_28683:1996-2259(+)
MTLLIRVPGSIDHSRRKESILVRGFTLSYQREERKGLLALWAAQANRPVCGESLFGSAGMSRRESIIRIASCGHTCRLDCGDSSVTF